MLELLDLRERGERLDATRLETDPTVADTVAGILRRVFVEGDDVLIELAHRFDGAVLSEGGVLVSDQEFEAAERDTPPELGAALDDLIARLRDLAGRQLPREWWEERDGVRFGEIVRPLESVGCYVPGGRAVYPSSVCMTVVPAVVAGVSEIVLCTPPQADGSVPSPVLYAARKAGAHYVAKTGGAQAVAAMAYGTESIPRVDRIVGPGNAYVTEAKRQVAGTVGIDGLAGPSELAIVAEGDVDIDMAALDLIAQAEHDPEARTFFITPDPDLVDRVAQALDEALRDAGRRAIVDAALAYAKAVLVRDLGQAAQVVNDLASEHLLLLLTEPEAFLPTVRNAGAIFLGRWSAVPFGDYGVASNHVLPTAGTARFSSGLRASDYVTVSSVVRLDKRSAARYAPGTAAIANAEGLVGHARAMDARAGTAEVVEP
ncbi:MAG: histidinol dehydrogenase [Actinomycetota bacterium]|nr:histidinol dehydrogenase [Actinomycetota bacterium]MDH5223896.1 histidinol dehydrogenase [Actinomycetota bacterium]